MKKTQDMPEIGSLWMDADEGLDCMYKYKGISEEPTFKGRMHFVRVNFETGKESEGGTWLGVNRFKTDMVPVEGLPKKPCCGRPTLYSIVWCHECGYETWDKARNEKAA